MNDRERDRLIEAAVSAWRPVDLDGRTRPHPAWADLSEADRRRVHRETELQRRIEGALDPDGLSSTARAVLRRVARRRP